MVCNPLVKKKRLGWDVLCFSKGFRKKPERNTGFNHYSRKKRKYLHVMNRGMLLIGI
jgi:hypothetical protein